MRRAVISLIVALVVVPVVHAGLPRSFDDAPLRAVQFIDTSEGWACGDDGVVWHTIDGGATWERLPTGVRGSLRALHFINPYTGWVVGREELPGGMSVGVVLFTTDGGLKWSRVASNTLPGLHAVRFFDDHNGMVAGDSTDRFSSGIFTTRDGGRTWAVIAAARYPGWRSADFVEPGVAVLGGPSGSLAMLREETVLPADQRVTGGRTILGVKKYQKNAFAVGQNGLVLKAMGDGWSDVSPRHQLGNGLYEVDFHAVQVFGEHVWAVGRPGSFVLHSSDEGKTWEIQPTGQTVPLHGIYFFDANCGWAVGDLGTILATTDGGKTWKIQRRGGERAAALFVHATATTTAYDTIAQLGGDEGYLIAAMSMLSPDRSASLMQAADGERFAAAVRSAGGAASEYLRQFRTADYLAASNPTEFQAAFDRLNGEGARTWLIRQMVLAIRTWQPDLVVGDEGTDGATSLCDSLLRDAFEKAADPNVCREQIEMLQLKPWSAKKLFATAAVRGRRYPMQMATSEPMTRCAESPREIALQAVEELLDPPAIPMERGFILIQSRLPSPPAPASLFEGIVLARGGTARRDPPALTPTELATRDEQVKILQARRNIEALARPDWKEISSPDKLIGQMGSMLRSLPLDQGARAAYAVARAFAQSGQWAMACEAFMMMAHRYPADPLTIEAYRWIARYAGSAEARRRHELGQFVATSEVHIRQAGAQSGSDLVHPTDKNWHAAALGIEGRMAALGPLFLHDPALQMSLQSARRSLGQVELANKWLTSFVKENPNAVDAWRDAAAAELWVATRSGQSRRPNGTCVMTDKKPQLDGKFDDECWQNAREMPLTPSTAGLDPAYTAKARFARDTEYLYLAIECQHPAGKQVAKAEKRQRDEDLQPFDRVGILIDVDRDYQTAFHLQIDQRGCLAEDCWGDSSWNPKWYVAVDSDANGWRAEAAIPLRELTGEGPTNGQAWACNVYRVIPGQGVMAWSQPAGVKPRPEGAGLLLFTEERK